MIRLGPTLKKSLWLSVLCSSVYPFIRDYLNIFSNPFLGFPCIFGEVKVALGIIIHTPNFSTSIYRYYFTKSSKV